MDFGLFSVIVPNDFRYKKIDGIDSFVGDIENGKSRFFFDYGMYSPSPPMDRKTFIQDSRESIDFYSLQTFFNQIDLKPYEDENGGVNPREITKKITNLTLHEMTEGLVIHRSSQKDCEYYYTFDFESVEYQIPFCIPKEKLEQFEFFELEVDTISNYKRTIAIWTNKNKPNVSSVNFEPINSDLNMNQLSIGIESDGGIDENELRTIFKSVALKNN